MDFAPYQVSPEETRALSPPPRTSTSSPRKSTSPIRRSFSPGVRSPAFMQSTSNAVNAAARNGNYTPGSGGGGNGSGNGNGSQNPWAQRDTGSYFPVVNGYNGDGNGNWERDVESGRGVGGSNYNAGSGGVYGGNNTGRDGLREFETSLPLRLDYEACLAYLFLPPAGGVLLLVLERKSDYVRFHAWQSALLFTAMFVVHLMFTWSPFMSWLLLLGDISLIIWLTRRAYLDADTLDRCEVPIFGKIASSILDDE